MRMIIIDMKFKKEKTYNNVTHVPRVGEQVLEFYQPSPTVARVAWHYEEENGPTVYVFVE